MADWIAEHGDVGLLSSPERYLWALGRLPRLKAKLAVLVFRSQCRPLLQDAQAALHTIQQACQQVQSHRAGSGSTGYASCGAVVYFPFTLLLRLES